MKTHHGIGQLDSLLMHNLDNPFVRMVRGFFFYPEAPRRTARVRSGNNISRKAPVH